MDPATGESRLPVSYRQLRAFHPKPSMHKTTYWVSHIEVNPSSTRVLFLHRWVERILFLYDMQTGVRHDLGSFHADPALSKENRCDLHPRWSRDGSQVCIDSVQGEGRQMYIVDVGHLTGVGRDR